MFERVTLPVAQLRWLGGSLISIFLGACAATAAQGPAVSAAPGSVPATPTTGSLEADSQRVAAQLALGDSLLKKERPDLAQSAYADAAQAAARHAELKALQLKALRGLAEAQLSLERNGDATATLERGLRLAEAPPAVGPGPSEFGAKLANVLASLGDWPRATELASRYGDGIVVEADSAVNGAAAAPTVNTASEAGAGTAFATPPSTPALPSPGSSAPREPTSPDAAEGAATLAADYAQKLSALRAGFRVCHQRGLQFDSSLAGQVRLTLEIGADGAVTATKPTASTLPRSVVDCLRLHAATAHFDPPQQGRAVVELPIVFVRR